MFKNKLFPIITSFVVIFSTTFCTFGGSSNDTSSTELEATLEILKITQTAMEAPVVIKTADSDTKIGTLPPTALSTPTQQYPKGRVSGQLSYPSESIPPLRVFAFSTTSNEYYYVETSESQSTYVLENLPPGSYQIIAYTLDGAFAGGFTQAVPCGLSVNCDDHSLINVTVVNSAETEGVNPGDWYAPPGTFPTSPIQ